MSGACKVMCTTMKSSPTSLPSTTLVMSKNAVNKAENTTQKSDKDFDATTVKNTSLSGQHRNPGDEPDQGLVVHPPELATATWGYTMCACCGHVRPMCSHSQKHIMGFDKNFIRVTVFLNIAFIYFAMCRSAPD